jgi:methylated-DNA-protein-cysteine methyltransferase-like protein
MRIEGEWRTCDDGIPVHVRGEFTDCPTGIVIMLDAFARLKGKVVAVVAAIPEGRVTTYGTIARHLHSSARQVARVMATLTPEESAALPWFRVVAAQGFVSTIKLGAVGRQQIRRLCAEGVAVTPRHRVEDFELVVWAPG